MSDGQSYTCPCCGYPTLSEPPGSFAICPICRWEDDYAQLVAPAMMGGANHVSLIQAQLNYRIYGVSDPEYKDRARAPKPENGEKRDPKWWPLAMADYSDVELKGLAMKADSDEDCYWLAPQEHKIKLPGGRHE